MVCWFFGGLFLFFNPLYFFFLSYLLDKRGTLISEPEAMNGPGKEQSRNWHRELPHGLNMLIQMLFKLCENLTICQLVQNQFQGQAG